MNRKSIQGLSIAAGVVGIIMLAILGNAFLIQGGLDRTQTGLIAAGVLFVVAVLLVNLVFVMYKRIDTWEMLEVDDGAEGKFVSLSDGQRMHYVSSGTSGESVILIHGLMDSTYSWAKNLDTLAQRYRVYAIDLIGFGFSSRMTERRYSFKYLARTVIEFMDAQQIDRAILVGHSLGGAVALEVAHDFPSHVSKLVLIAPGTYRLNVPAVANWAARMPVVPRALASLSTTSPRIRMASFRHALGNPSHMDEKQTTAIVQTTRVKGSTDALVAMAASSRASDLPQGMGSITTPTLIIAGDKDPAVPIKHATWHQQALPNAQLVVLEGKGHIPHVECPDTVNRLMLDFMGE